jgi:hypothetical protein
MFLGLFTIVPVLLVLLIVVIMRRRQTTRLKWAEIGTIIDRSLRSYRRNLVPLMALGATQFFLYVRERSLEQAVQHFTASRDAVPVVGSETSL